MDARAHQRNRPAQDGLVSRGAGRLPRPLGIALALCTVVALLAAVLGGLLRIGVAITPDSLAMPLAHAAVDHAALMIGAFMGTVIAIERAVALKWPVAWASPFLSAAAGLCLLAGAAYPARMLLFAASCVFVATNVLLVRRQSAPHTVLLLASAVCWLAGNGTFLVHASTEATVQWWFAYLLMTIAAERLEMTRLMRRRPAALPTLAVLFALLAASCAVRIWSAWGAVLFGAVLVALAAWLVTYDIARRTVRDKGLTRYMAVCLLAGYAWLALAGLAWVGWTLGLPWRDAALHALGLGFVFSMMLGHAPVVLPAVARVKLLYGPWFYVPLTVLNTTLAWRAGSVVSDTAMRAQGAEGNAIALLLFALTVIASALAWRRRSRPTASALRAR